MKLTNFSQIGRYEVIRDHRFESPGLLSDPQEGMLTFLENRRFLKTVLRSPALCVIAKQELAAELKTVPGLAVSSDPRRSFFLLHNHLAGETDFYWRGFPTEIDPTAKVHPRAWVAPRNVRIGPQSIVEPNATILERVILGKAVLIRAGAVLGSAGFQTATVESEFLDLEHAGGIRIEDNAHILANAVIAHAFFRQFTTIGPSTRVGNGAFISHNVRTGRCCIIGHGSIVNGYVSIGDDVWIGPGSSLANCITIGDRARISLGSAVIGDIAPEQWVTGNVAVDHFSYLRHISRVAGRKPL